MERKDEPANRSPTGRHGKRAESRLYTGAKLARVLARLGVDFREFVATYDADPSPTGSIVLTDAERAAVERFLRHRQISRLADELGTSIPSAHARVARFVLEKGPESRNGHGAATRPPP